MADTVALIDTSVLIDHFCKTNLTNTRLVQLVQTYDQLAISAVTEYEIFSGATPEQQPFWKTLLAEMLILPFDSAAAHTAVAIRHELKRKRKSIDTADLFIAAIAIANELTFDTLNSKHFIHIDRLALLTQQRGE